MGPPAMADGAAGQIPSDGDMAPGPPQGSLSLNPPFGSADTSSESGRGGVGTRATRSVQKPRTSGGDLRAPASQRARRSSQGGEITGGDEVRARRGRFAVNEGDFLETDGQRVKLSTRQTAQVIIIRDGRSPGLPTTHSLTRESAVGHCRSIWSSQAPRCPPA